MSKPPFTIRPATPGDREALGRLGALLFRIHYRFDRLRFMTPPAQLEEGYAAYLESQIFRDDVVVLVAEQGGRVVGYAYAGIEPLSWVALRNEAGFIHDVCVDEEARGCGIATALVEAAVQWLAGKGMPRVLLWTAAPNDGARRLFERLGFRHTMSEMTREVRPAS